MVAERAGEGAANVAEELALDQRLRQRTAVDGHEGAGRAVAAAVDEAREDLFAGPRLAVDQHGQIARSDAARELDGRAQGGRAADDALLRLDVAAATRQGLAQARQLGVLTRALHPERLVRAGQILLAPARLAVQARVLEREPDDVGQGLHQLAIGVAEATGLEAVVEVERADDARRRAHRHADDRAQAEVQHAAGAAQLRIVRGAGGDQRLAARQHALGDAAAEAETAVADGFLVEVARDGDLGAAAGPAAEQERALGAGQRDGFVEGQFQHPLVVVLEQDAADQRQEAAGVPVEALAPERRGDGLGALEQRGALGRSEEALAHAGWDAGSQLADGLAGSGPERNACAGAQAVVHLRLHGERPRLEVSIAGGACALDRPLGRAARQVEIGARQRRPRFEDTGPHIQACLGPRRIARRRERGCGFTPPERELRFQQGGLQRLP